MAELTRQRVKSIYSEIKGYHDALPEDGLVESSIVDNYHSMLAKLTELTDTDFNRHKLEGAKSRTSIPMYLPSEAKMSMSSVISRLESDYNFYNPQNNSTSPVVVTVSQNQQMSVNVVSIQDLITEAVDQESKDLLQQLKESVEAKDAENSKNVLLMIADKSWELFLRVLPYFLEQWGGR